MHVICDAVLSPYTTLRARTMRLRVLVAIILAARASSGQTVTPLSCEAVVPPSDSGSGRFGAVAEGTSGRLAWSDGRPGQVLVRDSRGTVRLIGRSGDGPGEFRTISAVGWRNDTLWTSDGRLRRVQFFSDTGRLLSVATGTPVVVWYPRPDGRLLGFVAQPLAPTPARSRTALGSPVVQPYAIVAQHPGDTRRDTIAVFQRAAVESFPLPPTGVLNEQPFAPRTVVASSPDASRFCRAHPEDSRTLLQCVDDRGRLLFNRSLEFSRRSLTDAVYDSMIALFARGQGRTAYGMRALINRPRQLPQVMAMMIDRGGAIWLRRSHEYEPVALWTRLRPDGAVRDDVVISKRYRLLRPDGDTFLAAEADSDGVETLLRCGFQ